MNKKTGLYIHIPFCKRKCLYCDFLSFPAEERDIRKYVDILTEELKRKSVLCEDYSVDTVFIGGGTPSFIPSDCIGKIMKTVQSHYNMVRGGEITLEANPGTLTSEKCGCYFENGINRISLGLQSASPSVLEFLRRIHRADEFVSSVEIARRAGFRNINADIIFGIPGQTIADTEYTVNLLTGMGIPHVSAYSLIIEEGTGLKEMIDKGTVLPPEDVLDRQMYYLIRDRLASAGFEQYEISNFAKPGYCSAHNLKYWSEDEYLGFGLGAASFFSKRRTKNLTDFAGYLTGNFTLIEDEYIDREEEMKEFMMLGFRKTEGPSVPVFRERYGRDMEDVFGNVLKKLVDKNLITVFRSGNTLTSLRLTEYGMDFANEVFMEFV